MLDSQPDTSKQFLAFDVTYLSFTDCHFTESNSEQMEKITHTSTNYGFGTLVLYQKLSRRFTRPTLHLYPPRFQLCCT